MGDGAAPRLPPGTGLRVDIHARLWSRALVILATQAAKTFLVALFVLFVFQRLVTQHLASMADYTRGLDTAHLDSPLVLRRKGRKGVGPDELDEVCSAINEMRESLRQELDERQRSEMASAFLARVGEVLLESLDLEVMLPHIASLYGELRRVGGAHVDAAKLPLLDELQRRYPPGPDSRSPVAQVVGWWDPRRLEQVVTGLLRNALKFGQGRPIDVRVTPRAGSVLLVVRDQGLGMSESEKQRIFDRFSRGVPEQHYGGLGLGLYLTRHLVEAHGGSISVESRPGEGSTFTVELPVVEAAGAAGGAGVPG
ncbi:sensor histidine kinase [Archangium sp.]|uniref:HAMP domain-containing sensor histidine kinase n=1 Tax=Archangium sp. TaxID=1872627 RepID=UPI002D698D39|nr:sensor histidine kinase [Archangium sp.]HYO59338.1 sensor histidine kinase [Archangium sp.]